MFQTQAPAIINTSATSMTAQTVQSETFLAESFFAKDDKERADTADNSDDCSYKQKRAERRLDLIKRFFNIICALNTVVAKIIKRCIAQQFYCAVQEHNRAYKGNEYGDAVNNA